jgi:hypothetical protein
MSDSAWSPSSVDSLPDYFPLHIGNVWRYYYQEALPDTVVGQTFTVSDTTRLDGKLYFRYLDSQDLTVLYRAEIGRVHRWVEDREIIWFDFTLAAGDTYRVSSGAWKPNVVILSKNEVVPTRAGTFAQCYHLLFDDPQAVDDAEEYWFAPDVGIVKMLWPHAIRPLLHSATINGRHYPEPVLTADEHHLSPPPKNFSMEAVYPNPFSPAGRFGHNLSTIRYAIPANIPPAGVRLELKVFNVLGQLVKVLALKQQTSGEYNMTWDGKDETGRVVPAGVYFVQLIAEPSISSGRRFVAERKVVVLR